MKKIYKIKVNGKVYEVELQEIKEGAEPIVVETKKEQVTPVAATGETVDAPMPGVVLDIKVKVGDAIKEGDLVAVLEAMKMETEIFSPKSGVVTAINVSKGAQVELGTALLSL